MPRRFRTAVADLFAPVLLCLLLLLLAASDLRAQSGNSYALLRKPTVSKTQIAFSYGGDLWIVDRNGGDARRLTSDAGIEIDPIFSPDGSMIAFTGEYDGNEDVYVIPAAGGVPKRLTSHPGSDQVAGWTRDGKRILFRSPRGSYAGFTQLFTVPLTGGLAGTDSAADGRGRFVLARQFASGVCAVHQFPGILAIPTRFKALSRRHGVSDLDRAAFRFQR